MNKSPNLICRNRSSVLIVDIQERLVPVVYESDDMIQNVCRLLDVSKMFQIPVVVSEQYPNGLGHTVAELTDHFDSNVIVFEKTTFSCRERGALFESLLQQGKDQVVVVGIEAHICVMQTCLDLMASGFQVFVPEDCISSRNPDHKDSAASRLEQAGAKIVVTESVLFEWCENAKDENFKTISKLVK